MRVVDVPLGSRSYSIRVMQTGLAPLGSELRDALGLCRTVVISDDTVAELYLDDALESLKVAGHTAVGLTMTPGEESKTITSVTALWERLMELEADRKTTVLALGGGIVGDVAGFVAATFNRGLQLVQVPTTLLSQVDSSVGGKTGFNLEGIKNVIGAFHQPNLVLTFVDTLHTLADSHFVAGLGEVIKHGALGRIDILDTVRTHSSPILERHTDMLSQLIADCCEVKRDIVVADEREAGQRKLLNFGHTFGHAIEAVTKHAILHGEAVSIGMVAACRLSEKLGICDSVPRHTIIETLQSVGLPTNDAPFWTPQVAEAMVLDKKRRGSDIDLVLLKKIGDPVIHRVPLTSLISIVTNGV